MPASYHPPRRPPPTFGFSDDPRSSVPVIQSLSRPHATNESGEASTSELSALVCMLFILMVIVGLVAWTLTLKVSELAMERRNGGRQRSQARREEEGTESIPQLL